MNINLNEFPLKENCLVLIEIALKIHKILGRALSKTVYKNAYEAELTAEGIPFATEQNFGVNLNGMTLRHNFYVDFLVNNSIIVEIRSMPFVITENDLSIINQLIISKPKIVLMINFYDEQLQFKKMVLI
ncbi:GxxExxY protein [Pedobacter aquatilis]|uniref:GxxExxY protein n=1 Tax=Pedobacter aquatilis TaxID=351343 RepID=UPI0029305772|nr:GxxExxY protein [Pedobacter aquatilis]